MPNKETVKKNASTVKHKKARPFEKLMVLLLHGKPVTKEEIAEKLGWNVPRGSKQKGPKIYNVSSYIWDIKNIPHIEGRSMVIKSIRDGKKVTSYQLMSLDDARLYLEKRGLVTAKKQPPAKKMSEAEHTEQAIKNSEAIQKTVL